VSPFKCLPPATRNSQTPHLYKRCCCWFQPKIAKKTSPLMQPRQAPPVCPHEAHPVPASMPQGQHRRHTKLMLLLPLENHTSSVNRSGPCSRARLCLLCPCECLPPATGTTKVPHKRCCCCCCQCQPNMTRTHTQKLCGALSQQRQGICCC
jgi:hypothetical protein